MFQWTILASAALALVLILVPDIAARAVGLAAEITFYKIYSALQQKEFEQWQEANVGVEPLSGWRAIGWGVVGLFLFFLVFFLVAIPLGHFFPSLTQ